MMLLFLGVAVMLIVFDSLVISNLRVKFLVTDYFVRVTMLLHYL